MRRTLIIIGAVVFLLLVGVGIYFLVFARKGTLTANPGGSFPSGDTTNTPPENTTPSTQELGVPSAGAGTDIAPHLVRISDKPVALGTVAVYVPGTTPVATTSASTTPVAGSEPDVRVEYIERESGNVYQYQAHARTLTRLSNKTLPGIQEASWLSDGSEAFVRFLAKQGSDEQIATYALPATGTGGGYFLEADLEQALVRGTTTLVTLLSNDNGSSATISTPSGTNVRTLFTSPLTSVRLGFSGANYILTTKGSSVSDGYAFVVDGKTGVFTRILGPLQSLSTLPSPDGKYLLYSYLDRGKLGFAVLDLTSHVATRLPLSTLPEKCAWTSDSFTIYCGVPTSITGTQPDDWYQGVTHFSDRLWSIDLASRTATLVIDPAQTGNVHADMVGITLDALNSVLLFTDRTTDQLYAYSF